MDHFNNRNGDTHWIPPSVPEAVDTWAETPWMRWTSTGMQPASAVGNSDVSVCSLFYNSETFYFLGVPYDCRRKSVKAERDSIGLGWRRLMFRYTDHEPPLSVVGFDSEYHVLAARGSSNWMPELVPPTYNQNQEKYHGVIASRTGIAGELSVILGMAALSCAPTARPENMAAYVLRVLGVSFRPPHWRLHKLKTGSECFPFHGWPMPCHFLTVLRDPCLWSRCYCSSRPDPSSHECRDAEGLPRRRVWSYPRGLTQVRVGLPHPI